jgi:glutaminyl-peptide cyclotransferase
MSKTPILILLIFLLSCKSEKKPDQQQKQIEKQVQVPNFSADSAFWFLEKQVSFGPRVPNSKSHEECKNFLYSEISKYADAVKLQEFTHSYLGKSFKLTNIIASFNLNSGFRVLLCAHWDSRPYADEEKRGVKENSTLFRGQTMEQVVLRFYLRSQGF